MEDEQSSLNCPWSIKGYVLGLAFGLALSEARLYFSVW